MLGPIERNTGSQAGWSVDLGHGWLVSSRDAGRQTRSQMVEKLGKEGRVRPR